MNRSIQSSSIWPKLSLGGMIRGAALGGVLLSFATGAGAAQATNRGVDEALNAMRASSTAPLTVVQSPKTGLATFISAGNGGSIAVADRIAANPSARALSFIDVYGTAFGLRRENVRVSRVETDALGMDHVRLQQLVGGIPVTGGEMIIHLRGRNVMAANGQTLADPETISTAPSLTALDASGRARDLATKKLNAADATLSEPRLEIFSRPHLGGRDFPTRLAWFVEIKSETVREFVWIDAQSGMTLLHFSQRPDAKNRSVYNGNNLAALPGTLIRSEGGAATGDADADAAYTYAGITYDYYLSNHNRDSYDNAGAPLKSTVHHCPTQSANDCPYENAFWNGTQMVYGDGFAVADDVVAHELTHAVTEHSANLFYYMQSGALNESFSDIFGETVDLTSSVGGGDDSAGARWKLGEDIGAIRNMMDPTLFSDPGKMSDSQFRCEYDPVALDAGGVHTNSGVPNHAYALMVDGGTYNSIAVTGIGLTKAAKIQYRALTQYLTSASNFLDNYNALQQACTDLIGTAGIDAGNCASVKNAIDAVQMANPWPCGSSFGNTSAKPAVCSAGQHAVNSFFDNFESGLGNWTISGTTGTWFRASSPSNPLQGVQYGTSGVDSLLGYSQGITSLSTIGLASNVSIPAGAKLQFDHSFGFDNDSIYAYDGGLIEYTTNNGTTWQSLSSLYAAGANYNGQITNQSDNPLAPYDSNPSLLPPPVPAFVKDSFGFTASQYDLSSLAGQNVKFRFRIATDSSVDDYGWFIDDFRVYTCATPAEVASPANGSTFVSASQTFTWNAAASVSEYWLDIGSSPGTHDVYNASQGLNLSKTVTGLPVDGRALYARLWSLIAGTWYSNSYTYTAYTAPDTRATLTSPSPSSTLAGSSQTFNWNTGTGNTQYWLSIGSTFGTYDLYGADQGSNLSANVTGLPTDGRTLYVRLFSLNSSSGWQSKDFIYTAYTAPIVSATMVSPTDGATLTSPDQTFTWSAGGGIVEYWLSVGTTPGGIQIYGATQGTNLSKLLTGLPTNGSTIYVTLWSRAGSTWTSNAYTYTTATVVKAAMTSPSNGSTLTGASQTFSWNAGSGNAEYWLSVGTTSGGSQIYSASEGTSLSRPVSGLPANGSTVYVRLWSRAGTVWTSNDYTYTAISNQATMTSPAQGSALAGSTQTFTWSAGTGNTEYWLSVGTTAGGSQLYNASQGMNLSVPLPGLPQDGSTIYVRLWSLNGGTWLYRDTTYTAYSPAASITSPTSGSSLTNSGGTETFTWNTGTGVTEYWLSVGTTLGGTQISDGTQGSNLSKVVSGLPTNGSTVYVRLWSRIGSGTPATWISKDFTYVAYSPAATVTSPVNGSTLVGTSTTFAWNTGTGVNEYWLSVGTTPGGTQISDGTLGTNLSKVVTGIPTGGSTVYVRLWSRIGASTWLSRDFTYVAAP